MRLAAKLALSFAALFAAFGAGIGLLDFRVRAGWVARAAVGKASGAAVAAANFASCDASFASPENLAAAARRAGLESLRVLPADGARGMPATLHPSCENGFRASCVRFSGANMESGDCAAEAVAKSDALGRLESGFALHVAAWTFSGAGFGGLLGLAAAGFVLRDIRRARAKMGDGNAESALPVISEFADLADVFGLFNAAVRGRFWRAGAFVGSGAPDAAEYSAAPLLRDAMPLSFESGGMRASAEFVGGVFDGSFFSECAPGAFVFGRVSGGGGALALAKASTCAAVSRALVLAGKPAAEVFGAVSEAFGAESWSLVRLEGGCLLRESFGAGGASCGRIENFKSALFSTAVLGAEPEGYCSLGIGGEGGPLAEIAAAFGPGGAGLAIFAERIYEENI